MCFVGEPNIYSVLRGTVICFWGNNVPIDWESVSARDSDSKRAMQARVFISTVVVPRRG